MAGVIRDSALECLRLLPFLFITYLIVEYIEHRMSARTKEWIYRAGRFGPLLGSLCGVIPQCGFSAVAAGLFAAHVVSPGTLIAVFLSTSDEMLPIMLSERVAFPVILRILVVKVVAGTLIGFLVDFAAQSLHLWQPPVVKHPLWKYSRQPGAFTPIRARRLIKGSADESDRNKADPASLQNMPYSSPAPGKLCENDHCGCERHGIFLSALYHTAQIMLFLFLISLFLGFCMEWFTSTAFSKGIFSVPVAQEAIAALIGMIPNCAASVFITQLYLSGVLTAGALFAGLLTGAGTGLLVLFREDKNRKEDLLITVLLYVSGLAAGFLAGCLQIL